MRDFVAAVKLTAGLLLKWTQVMAGLMKVVTPL